MATAALDGTKRWGRDRRLLVDVAFAGLITLLSLVDSVGDNLEPGQRAADAGAFTLIVIGGGSLIWRRRVPILVLAIVTVAMSAYWLRDHGSFLALMGLPALYAVAVHEDNRRRAWTAISIASALLMLAAGVSILDEPDGFAYPNALSMAAYLAAGTGVGVVIRNRERIFVDTQRRAEVAEADRLAEAQRAVARERSRIAREMHDVVAHGMSVIAVQASAAQEIVHTNPDKAAEVMGRIEHVGRESLSEMRRMLGVLRNGEELDQSLAPQPTLRDVTKAVALSNESGVPTALTVSGQERDLSPGIELAAFRVVQESLTNVRKHAGRSASAKVHIDYRPEAIAIEITDDGAGAASSLSGSGTGNGQIGMRERVEIYDGDFSAGPRTGGGYAVRVVLPLTDENRRPGVASAADPHEAPQ